MPLSRTLFTTLSVLVLASCSPSTLDLRDDIELYRSSFREKLRTKDNLAQQFLASTRQPYSGHVADAPSSDTSPHPASASVPGASEGSITPLRALIQHIRERQAQQTDSLLALQEVVFDMEEEPQRRIDLDQLHKIVRVIPPWHGHVNFDEDILAQDSSRFAPLLVAYNKAYFGNLSFKTGQTASGEASVAWSKSLRTGSSTGSGTPSYFPDSRRKSQWIPLIFCMCRIAWKSQEQTYPEFDAARPPIPHKALAWMTRDALRAEAGGTSAVGKVVRGKGVVRLRNETLAAMLETATGVMTKKLVEHEGFCYFQVTECVR
jgi:hypothetical protein